MKETKSGRLSAYKIPTDAVIENRKLFYSLKKESTETICKWLNRLQNSIDSCEFAQRSEYHLIDKFFSELNKEEICQFRRAKKWSVAKLVAIDFGDDEKFGVKTRESSQTNKIPTNAENIRSVSTF